MNYEVIWGKKLSGRESSMHVRVGGNQIIRENRGKIDKYPKPKKPAP